MTSISDTNNNGNFIELTAEIVSAYVSNNTVPAGEIASLINQVHAALSRVSGKPAEGSGRAAEAGDLREEIDHAGIHRLFGGREEVQVAQAASAHAVQYDAGAVSREMGPEQRLSDGRAELRRRALAIGQADGFGPATSAPHEIAAIAFQITASLQRAHAVHEHAAV